MNSVYVDEKEERKADEANAQRRRVTAFELAFDLVADCEK